MAPRALSRWKIAFVHQVFDTGMAIDAEELGVDRFFQRIRQDDGQEHVLALQFACQLWIVVTVDAVVISETFGGRGCRRFLLGSNGGGQPKATD
jgi:hypothetical protein